MKEKYVQMLIDIPDYILDDIKVYCLNNNISVNHLINTAVINDISDQITPIKITKKLM